ncbi:MAG: sigma 54-interacting transcriptional regulator [Bacillota bacterium]
MAPLGESLVTALLDGLVEGVLAVAPDGRIRLVNGAMAQLLGARQDDLLGRRPADLEAAGVWLPPVLRRCLETRERQALILERAGRRLALTAAPLPDGWVLATARDITELDRLQRQVERMAQDRERYHHELAGLRAGQAGRTEVVGSSPAMQRVMDLVRRVAPVDSTILLLGESGVGKGVLAAEIHRLSPRRSRPFVRIDCAALPESLLESELFGYSPGSFTGARREGKPGLIEQAHGGTLFIDAIGDVPLELQVKLLHVIQERRIIRLGAVTPTAVDIRIIAATHRDLEAMVAEGRFRADLYYRLNVVPIRIPPLRERPEDIPVLARAFLETGTGWSAPSRRRRWRASWLTPGRATCGSWRTSSSGWWSRWMSGRSGPSTCPCSRPAGHRCRYGRSCRSRRPWRRWSWSWSGRPTAGSAAP